MIEFYKDGKDLSVRMTGEVMTEEELDKRTERLADRVMQTEEHAIARIDHIIQDGPDDAAFAAIRLLWQWQDRQ